MKKLIKFSSIEQFRNVIYDINHKYHFIGVDENGDPKYDHTLPKPTITFKGTVKLHGTNAGVSYNRVSGLWAQSKENIITPEKDNMGFASFVQTKKDIFIDLIEELAKDIDLNSNTITLFGEWAGGNIQKNVAISNIEKSFFVFGAKVTPFNEEEKSYWIDSSSVKSVDERIYNIEDFETFSIDINFDNPQMVQNTLGEFTQKVEAECPVGKAFGFSGVGEGVVWLAYVNGERYCFKVKGEKHSVSKVKTLAAVDVDKLNSINEFVDYAVTENRFNQALENVFPNGEQIDIKKLGDVIRWVIGDIVKEETDTMSENNLEPKEVNKYISIKVRNMFLQNLK